MGINCLGRFNVFALVFCIMYIHLIDTKPIESEGPVRVIKTREKYDENETEFTLDENTLKSILEKKGIKDLPVVVISIAGDFRKGKSFMLNFFLRYLEAKSRGQDNWLREFEDGSNSTGTAGTGTTDDEPLKGFEWKSGSEGHTSGVLIWSQVFKIRNSANEDVAVILMDTQGTFDNESSDKECTTIFALSTLLSSVQIYNLKENISKKDLDHLQFFVNYGMQALETSEDKPFQTLYFLIRDWSAPHEYPYGKGGGQQLIDKRLERNTVAGERPEKFVVAKNIKNCFDTISCFLMPHPGKTVATSPHFNGVLSEIDSEFLDNVKNVVEDILAPENLVTKRISGRELRVKDLLSYFRSYVKVFNGDKLGRIKSLTDANAEANMAHAVSDAEEYYMRQMVKVFSTGTLDMTTLECGHKDAKNSSLEKFASVKLFGGPNLRARFQEDLIRRIDDRLPGLKFKLRTGSRQQHEDAVSSGINFYNEYMDEYFSPTKGYVWPSLLLAEHEKPKKFAVERFTYTPMWKEDMNEKIYLQKLKKEIERELTKLKEANDKKWSAIYYFYPNYWLKG